MDYVAILILQALQAYYPTPPEQKQTREQERFKLRKEKEERNKTENPMQKIMRYGLRFKREQDKGITPGYHRRLANFIEFLTSIMYENSHHFREAIKEIEYQMKDPWFHDSQRMTERRNAKWACMEMQHPELQRETGDPEIDEMEYRFRLTEEYEEQGKTYAWFLKQKYGGENGFANQTWHGKCRICAEPLAVWRRCRYCAHYFFLGKGRNIYVTCMECTEKRHQWDLEDIDQCERCWGPPEISIAFYVPLEEEYS